jgi:hypothetical protein
MISLSIASDEFSGWKFIHLTFYRGVFIIASQSLDLGHNLTSFETVSGTGCLDRALRSRNWVSRTAVRIGGRPVWTWPTKKTKSIYLGWSIILHNG